MKRISVLIVLFILIFSNCASAPEITEDTALFELTLLRDSFDTEVLENRELAYELQIDFMDMLIASEYYGISKDMELPEDFQTNDENAVYKMNDEKHVLIGYAPWFEGSKLNRFDKHILLIVNLYMEKVLYSLIDKRNVKDFQLLVPLSSGHIFLEYQRETEIYHKCRVEDFTRKEMTNRKNLIGLVEYLSLNNLDFEFSDKYEKVLSQRCWRINKLHDEFVGWLSITFDLASMEIFQSPDIDCTLLLINEEGIILNYLDNSPLVFLDESYEPDGDLSVTVYLRDSYMEKTQSEMLKKIMSPFLLYDKKNYQLEYESKYYNVQIIKSEATPFYFIAFSEN